MIKYFLLLILLQSFLFSYSQVKNESDLFIEIKDKINCDSVIIINENNPLNVIKVSFTNENLKLLNFLNYNKYKTNIVSIFFKNNNFNVLDTLYFIYTSKNANVVFNNYSTINRNGIFDTLIGIYNFEYLYSMYSNTIRNKRDSNQNSLTNLVQKEKFEQSLSTTKYKFLEENLKNPYLPDFFLNFIINDVYLNYTSLDKFYRLKLVNKINNTKIKNLIQIGIAYKNVANKENIIVPYFTSKSIDGKVVSSLELKGKFYMLCFWATWCKPCIDEIPALKKIFLDYPKEKLKIISISLDNEKSNSNFTKIIKDNNLNWIHVLNDKKIIKQFGINPIPHIFLINNKGIIIYNSILRKSETKELNILQLLLKEQIK